MKIKCLVDVYDVSKGVVYDVVSKSDDMVWVKILDEEGEVMYLFNDGPVLKEFEVVAE